MNFWRTLFHRQGLPTHPAYPVTGVVQPTPPVTTVAAPPIGYQTLTLSSTRYVHGTPASFTVNNALGGTVIVPVGLPTGITINAAARTGAWDGTGAAGSGSFTLYENIPGASSNPHASVIAYTISGGSAGQFYFNTAAGGGLIVVLEDI